MLLPSNCTVVTKVKIKKLVTVLLMCINEAASTYNLAYLLERSLRKPVRLHTVHHMAYCERHVQEAEEKEGLIVQLIATNNKKQTILNLRLND
jgi:hypothetical protein